MQLTNTSESYGVLARVLHWLMAVLVIALLALGIYMVRLPDVGFDTRKITLVLIHKEIGVLALTLAVLRLAWRRFNPVPQLAETVPEWQQIAAAFVHLWLYAVLLAQPITGWLMSSAAGIPVDLLGLFSLPDLVSHDEDLFARLRELHDWLGCSIAILVGLHAAAALRHHFILRDQTLWKMLGRRAHASSAHAPTQIAPHRSVPSPPRCWPQ